MSDEKEISIYIEFYAARLKDGRIFVDYSGGGERWEEPNEMMVPWLRHELELAREEEEARISERITERKSKRRRIRGKRDPDLD